MDTLERQRAELRTARDELLIQRARVERDRAERDRVLPYSAPLPRRDDYTRRPPVDRSFTRDNDFSLRHDDDRNRPFVPRRKTSGGGVRFGSGIGGYDTRDTYS